MKDHQEISEILSRECASWAQAETVEQLNQMYKDRIRLDSLGVAENAIAGIEAARMVAWLGAMQVCIFSIPKDHQEFFKRLGAPG